MKQFLSVLMMVALAACQAAEDGSSETTVEADMERLAATLAAQPKEIQARYEYRHPQETLAFFGIKPGMTVVEGLPGRGWYSKVLLPYLGAEGKLIGANYSLEMYPFFSYATEEFMKTQQTWITDWIAEAETWRGEDGASPTAFHMGSMPAEMVGTADAVLFIRVLHNLARFEIEGDYLVAALADAFAVLKPGGIFGVVQHRARDEMTDTFADGSHGYLKKSFVIVAAEQAGFEFIAASDINANAADQPSEEDIVWRLPPSLFTSKENPELKAQLEAVGESNRMTLKFRKPE